MARLNHVPAETRFAADRTGSWEKGGNAVRGETPGRASAFWRPIGDAQERRARGTRSRIKVAFNRYRYGIGNCNWGTSGGDFLRCGDWRFTRAHGGA
jgi:hypothetical protein